MRVCLYVLFGHLLGKGWPLGSRLWCLLWVCHFPIDILGQVWYLIVSIPDLCTLTYFGSHLLAGSWLAGCSFLGDRLLHIELPLMTTIFCQWFPCDFLSALSINAYITCLLNAPLECYICPNQLNHISVNMGRIPEAQALPVWDNFSWPYCDHILRHVLKICVIMAKL